MTRRPTSKLGKRLYCWVMRLVWKVGKKMYDFAEDRRPGGGFHPKNLP